MHFDLLQHTDYLEYLFYNSPHTACYKIALSSGTAFFEPFIRHAENSLTKGDNDMTLMVNHSTETPDQFLFRSEIIIL